MGGGLVTDLARGLLDLVFAPVCVACRSAIPAGQEERIVCRACWSRARAIPEPRCPRCWSPVLPLVPTSSDARCPVCPSLPPSLRCVRSAYVLHGPAREMVHALKYGGWHALGAAMARRMGALEMPLEVTDEVRLVVPVPVSAARRRQRGYNQAEPLAAGVAAARGWSAAPGVLVRRASTRSQTALHPSERAANVAGAFAVPRGLEREVRHEHILLVDDVWTTGATALACCEALLGAGARAVSVVTFARALPELHR